MTYIIAEPCVSTCDTACVEVCPVDCIHGPDDCLLYTSPSPRDRQKSRMPSSA